MLAVYLFNLYVALLGRKVPELSTKSRAEIKEQALIYRKSPLTDFQESVNAAAIELALQNPSLVRKGNRGDLLELARKQASQSYSFKKGVSHSKAYGSWKDKMPTPKRPKFDKEMRDSKVAELNEVVSDLTKRITIKENRCRQAEAVRNYKLCDELIEDFMELKSSKREKEKQLMLFKKKEKRSKRYQEVKGRRLSESSDKPSRSRSTTPGIAPTPFSPPSGSTGSYSCDASASESESIIQPLSPPLHISATSSNYHCRT